MLKKLRYLIPISTLLFSIVILPNANQLVFAKNAKQTQKNTNVFSALQKQLESLMIKHQSLAGQELMARYDQSSGSAQAKQQLDQNTENLSTVVGNLYDQTTGGQFRNLWYYHVDLLNEYADAKRNNDQTTQDQKIQALGDFENNLATLLTQPTTQSTPESTLPATPNPVTQSQLRQALQLHVNDEITFIDTYAGGGDTQSLTEPGEANVEALADLIYQASPYSRNNSELNNLFSNMPNANGLLRSFVAHFNVLKNNGKGGLNKMLKQQTSKEAKENTKETETEEQETKDTTATTTSQGNAYGKFTSGGKKTTDTTTTDQDSGSYFQQTTGNGKKTDTTTQTAKNNGQSKKTTTNGYLKNLQK